MQQVGIDRHLHGGSTQGQDGLTSSLSVGAVQSTQHDIGLALSAVDPQGVVDNGKQLVVLLIHGGNATVAFVGELGELAIVVGDRVAKLVLQAGDFTTQLVQIVLGLLIGRALGGALDVLQQLGLVTLEVFVIEADVTGRARVDIRGENGIASELAEAYKI